MVYNHFVTALTQRLEEVELLPLPEEAVTGEAVKIEGSYIFEPDERDVLADLIPRYSRSPSTAPCWNRPRRSTAPA